MEWKEKNSSSNGINHKRPIIERPIILYPAVLRMNARMYQEYPLKMHRATGELLFKVGTIVSSLCHNDHGKT